jgi:YesN/AraC family two-component response regulator
VGQKTHALLWIDLTVGTKDPGTQNGFADLFDVHTISSLMPIEAAIRRVKPVALCFDFDYPTKDRLKLLQRTKQAHVSLPIVMLTAQHSEALAIWAFRSRVWDYLVKPVAKTEVDRCLGCLGEMLDAQNRGAAPRRAAMPVSVIPEENRTTNGRGQPPLALAAVLDYVDRNYSGKITSAKAASLCGLTPFQFSRTFKEAYGITFLEYLPRFRIREACRLLSNPNAQVADVAHLVGFNDPSYFGKVLRRYTKMSPSNFATADQNALDPERLLDVLNAD